MKNYDSIVESAHKRSDNSKQRVVSAIEELTLLRKKITVSSVSKAAGVSRNYIYTHADLYELIVPLREATCKGIVPDSKDSVISILKKEIRRLKKALAEAEEADLESDSWHSRYKSLQEKYDKLDARCKELRNENADLKRQLEASYTFGDAC